MTMTMTILAGFLSPEGHHDEAEQLLRDARNIAGRVPRPDNSLIALSTYNLACIEALKGNSNGGLSLLQEAIDHDLPPNADLWMEKDPGLRSLHGDPRFDALVAHAKERAAAAQKRQ